MYMIRRLSDGRYLAGLGGWSARVESAARYRSLAVAHRLAAEHRGEVVPDDDAIAREVGSMAREPVRRPLPSGSRCVGFGGDAGLRR